MTVKQQKRLMVAVFAIPGLVTILLNANLSALMEIPRSAFRPAVPKEFTVQMEMRENAVLNVAKVFGRSGNGCADADNALIDFVARTANLNGLDPKIAAATIATESGCNPLAVSKSGALGMTQVMPKIWKAKYDFSQINLLNGHVNIRVGLEIEAGLIRQWGVKGGITHYQGTAVGCDTCDDGYTGKILKLANGK